MHCRSPALRARLTGRTTAVVQARMVVTPATPVTATIDTALDGLQAKKQEWLELPLGKKVNLLKASCSSGCVCASLSAPSQARWQSEEAIINLCNTGCAAEAVGQHGLMGQGRSCRQGSRDDGGGVEVGGSGMRSPTTRLMRQLGCCTVQTHIKCLSTCLVPVHLRPCLAASTCCLHSSHAKKNRFPCHPLNHQHLLMLGGSAYKSVHAHARSRIAGCHALLHAKFSR